MGAAAVFPSGSFSVVSVATFLIVTEKVVGLVRYRRNRQRQCGQCDNCEVA